MSPFYRKSVRALVFACSTVTTVTPGMAQDHRIDSLQQQLKNASDTIEVRLLNQLSEAVRKKKPLDAIDYGKQAVAKAEKLNFKSGLTLALHNTGLAYGYNNDFTNAIEYLERSSQLAEENSDLKSAAWDYLNIGSIYSLQGNNQKWIEFYLKGLKHYEKINDKKGIAQTLYGIGNSLSSEKKYDQALEHYFKSIELFEELNETGELPKVYVNIAKLYEDKRDYNQALEYYKKSLDGFDKFSNRRGRATAMVYRANTYFLMKDYSLAISDLEEAIRISEQSDYQVCILDSRVLLGRVHQALKQYDLAIDQLSRASELAKRLGSKAILSTSYQLLAECYEAKADYKNAFNYQGLHARYDDSTFSTTKSKQIQELQFRYDTEKKEEQIAQLKRDRTLSLMVGIAGAILVLTIGFLMINRQKLKIRNDRELSQKENQLLEERKSLIEADLTNRKLNEEQLRHQIDFNNKEMTTYALHLIQKNELLENIKSGIEEIRSAETDQIKPKLQSLLNTVNYSFHLDKDWENFRMHFEQVHQSFFDKLNELFPDLGANDIKLCALIRLNLDTKTMATVLDISPESAKVARHRLRKKLSLVSEQNLTSFLSNI